MSMCLGDVFVGVVLCSGIRAIVVVEFEMWMEVVFALVGGADALLKHQSAIPWHHQCFRVFKHPEFSIHLFYIYISSVYLSSFLIFFLRKTVLMYLEIFNACFTTSSQSHYLLHFCPIDKQGKDGPPVQLGSGVQ